MSRFLCIRKLWRVRLVRNSCNTRVKSWAIHFTVENVMLD